MAAPRDYDLGRLKGRKLFVGTPMYDGKCFSEYAFSIVRLTALCAQLDIGLHFYFAGNEALIAKARNETVEQFLESGADSLVFIDADIGFDARDVIQLFAMQLLHEAAYDILAAPYPLKRLSWSRVLTAAKRGLADDNPDALAGYSSAINVELAEGSTLRLDAPAEVTQAGTGFMMIRRTVFERFRDHYPERHYVRPGAADPFAFFETEIDNGRIDRAAAMKAFLARRPDATAAEMLAFLEEAPAPGAHSGLYLSEDYAFCRRARQAGIKVWLCPWTVLTHTGHHRFESRLADLGAIGPI